MNSEIFERDKKIDILRFIAMLCIILAHSQPNTFIFQIRNFDVPLIIILMGASFYISRKEIGFMDYVKKRFKRLVLPTWKFLTFFLAVLFLI